MQLKNEIEKLHSYGKFDIFLIKSDNRPKQCCLLLRVNLTQRGLGNVREIE